MRAPRRRARSRAAAPSREQRDATSREQRDALGRDYEGGHLVLREDELERVDAVSAVSPDLLPLLPWKKAPG